MKGSRDIRMPSFNVFYGRNYTQEMDYFTKKGIKLFLYYELKFKHYSVGYS